MEKKTAFLLYLFIYCITDYYMEASGARGYYEF